MKGATENSLALVVMARDYREPLLASLESLGISVLAVRNCRETRQLLQGDPGIELVITATTLSDGNWTDVLKCLEDGGVEASVVVTSAHADERFWSEALWRGVYDLLVEPYERDEAQRTVQGAIRAARASRTGLEKKNSQSPTTQRRPEPTTHGQSGSRAAGGLGGLQVRRGGGA